MEKINFRAVERSTQDVSVTINSGNSERWAIQSQKTKYVMVKSPELLRLIILLASIIPRIIFWRKTRVTMRFRLLHNMTVLLELVYLLKTNLEIELILRLLPPKKKNIGKYILIL